jgi:hypothetical protein
MTRSAALLVALLTAGCGQKIVVIECDGSQNGADGTATGSDGPILNGDGDFILDGGMTGSDAQLGVDAMMQNDGGSVTCANAPYCIRMLSASSARANVGDIVTFTPQVDNPQHMPLVFHVDPTELQASRRAGLPPAHLADLTLSLSASSSTGHAVFVLSTVPTWYAGTTFTVRLHASATGGPDVYADSTVTIRGNTLLADQSVYAVASNGAPAKSVNFMHGELISGASFVDTPRNLVLAQDGTLVLYDWGATPPRLRRFDLSGENVGLGDFASTDAMMMPLIPDDNGAHGMVQLMDGRFALAVFSASHTPHSSIVLWKSNGDFDRVLRATDPIVEWSSVAANPTSNELWVLESATAGSLFRLNPDSGAVGAAIATDIDTGRSVVAIADSHAYVGTEGAILRVTPANGGKQMIGMLQGGAFDYWNALAAFSDGRVMAASDNMSDFMGLVIIDQATSLGFLRQSNAGNVVIEPLGLVYLE